MKDSKWIDSLREMERDYEQPAPDGLWDDIEKRLLPVSNASRGALAFRWLRFGGVAAALAVMVGLAWMMLVRQPSEPMPKLISANKGEVVEQSSASLEAVAETTLPERGAVDVAPRLKSGLYAHAASSLPDGVTLPGDTLGMEQAPSRGSDAASDAEPAKVEHREVQTVHEPADYAADWDIPALTKKGGKKLSFTAYASNLMRGSHSDGVRHTLLSSGDFGSWNSPNHDDGNPTEQAVMRRVKPLDEETRHHLPLRFGVSMRFPLADRMHIETGVTYSLLRSTTTAGGRSYYNETDQTLHYIGIPVKFSYDIYAGDKWSVYASGGAMAEKCVHGRASTTHMPGSSQTPVESENVTEGRLQFSVMAGVGVAYSLSQKVDIFVEPGVSNYFDNHSSVTNIYKDRPLNFDLKVGLRLNLGR